MNPKTAVYCGSRNIYPDMAVSLKSLLLNSDVEQVYLLIEDDEFPFRVPECVKTINISGQQFFRADGPNMDSPYTYFAMMRTALPFVLPDHDVVLSLDCDTIIDKDISGIWEYVNDDCYFSAVKETHRSHNGQLYTNAGVVLYNLKKLRDGKAEEIIWVLNNRYYTWIDQDVQNYLCQGRIQEMPSCYNVNDWTEKTEDKRIIHYAGIKVFQGNVPYLKYSGIPFEDIKR